MKQLVHGPQKTTPYYIIIGLANVVMIECGFKCRLKMRPFIQVDLTINLVFQTKGILHISTKTTTTLLNIMRSQTQDSELFVELRRRFPPLTNIWKRTGDIDRWIQRLRRWRVSGNTINNGSKIIPEKRGGHGTRHGRRRRHIDN